jgi:hypothetical protein
MSPKTQRCRNPRPSRRLVSRRPNGPHPRLRGHSGRPERAHRCKEGTSESLAQIAAAPNLGMARMHWPGRHGQPRHCRDSVIRLVGEVLASRPTNGPNNAATWGVEFLTPDAIAAGP